MGQSEEGDKGHVGAEGAGPQGRRPESVPRQQLQLVGVVPPRLRPHSHQNPIAAAGAAGAAGLEVRDGREGREPGLLRVADEPGRRRRRLGARVSIMQLTLPRDARITGNSGESRKQW